MKAPKTPAAPDPVATASAQAGANRDTAITQGAMNMIDQVGPDGSLTYEKTGDQTFTDSLTGQTYTVPKYRAVTSLSESGQRVQGLNNQTQENIATIGRDQSARIGELLSTPLKIGNEATEARLMELGSKRLDPKFARDEEALRTRLINSGIRQGSAAWDAEMSGFNQGKNDAFNNLLLTGRQQAVQEQLTERNQPINEISALLSGSQIGVPQFQQTPQTNLAGTDYMGAVYNSYNGQMQAAQMKQQSQNAMMGGLFGLAGNVAKMFVPTPSDRRLKTDITIVGALANGLPVYTFRYRADPAMLHTGLMSDDVRKVKPEAVMVMPDGYDAVDYNLAMGV